MAFEFGEDSAVAITQTAATLEAYSVGASGAATTIYSIRIEDFGAAVKRYQNALLEYRNIVMSNPETASSARQKAIDTFQKMQMNFHREIK
jgi:hypothetical protein